MSELELLFLQQVRILVRSKRLAGLPEPEFRFHPKRKWRFDFAWPAQKLAVEIEGGTWVGGAHNRGAHFASDAEKYNEAVLLGWRVLRFDNHMVEDGRAVDCLMKALEPQVS